MNAAASVANQGMAMMGGGGMNQMLELFKMQYLMKFLDGGQSKSGASLFTMMALMGYDQLVKYLPIIISAALLWFQTKLYGPQDKKTPTLLLPTQTPPPAQKTSPDPH